MDLILDLSHLSVIPVSYTHLHCMLQTQDNVMVEALEGLVNVKWKRGWRRSQMMDDLQVPYQELKQLAQDRKDLQL